MAILPGMGRLTTHILDTASGGPAMGVRLVLRRIHPQPATLIERHSDADGRAGVLLEGEALLAGVYELDFDIGAYFRAHGQPLPEPAFLDVVTLRFGIAHPDQHYHVPLLASPWSYATYRGS